jgi:hypothetical protein
MGYVRKNVPRGAKKSDKTILWCNQIAEELKKGDCSSYDLRMKFGIKESLFPALLVQLTYIAPIYDYKINGKLYLGLIKK